MDQHPLILGAHLSIGKGLDHTLYRAAEMGSNALQIFTKNASTWREKALTGKQIADFQAARKTTGITAIAAHTAYLVNIAAADGVKTAMSVEALYRELVRCEQLGIPFVVLHPGSHLGEGEDAGTRRVAENLNRIFNRLAEGKTRVLLETTAGQGSCLGHRFEQLATMADGVEDAARIGFCLDTCHVFTAGYDISNSAGYAATVGTFDRIIGLQRLFLIHVNDSKKPLGSRVDRHEHIGEGCIGEAGFSLLMNDPRLADIPKIIETPKEKDGKEADPDNLARLRGLYRG